MATYPGAPPAFGTQPPYGASSYGAPQASLPAPQPSFTAPPQASLTAPLPSYNSPSPYNSYNRNTTRFNVRNVPQIAPVEPPQPAANSGKYRATIFFDNSQKHIDQIAAAGISSQVTAIKVPSMTYAEEVPFDEIPNSDENYYVDLAVAQGYDSDKYDSTSGIRVGAGGEEARQFDEWLARTEGTGRRVAIFDWDRTISKSERLLISKDASFWSEVNDAIPEYTSDMLIYLLGGTERIEEIRSFMRRISDAGVDIVFMSNNGGCTNMKPIIEELMGPIVFKSMCSRGAPYNGDKGRMIRDELLVTIGGRRKRTRRKPLRRRSNRRRNTRRR